MDSITQAVLGRWQGRKALLYGAMLGTLPDMDVIIDYGDAVADMTYHRGFSHSLIVLTGLALLLTWLTRRLRHNPGYSTQRLFFTLWLVLLTHPLLDAFTSYGTQLFWPLMPTPTAWSSIFIIDPLYTLPLGIAVVIGLLYGLRDKTPRVPAIALLLSTLYLASTLGGKYMAEQRVEAELARQGIQADALFSTPTPFNSLLWRGGSGWGGRIITRCWSVGSTAPRRSSAGLPAAPGWPQPWPTRRRMHAWPGSPTACCATTSSAISWW